MTNQNLKILNILLWISQILLAFMFIMVGFMKTSQSIEELAKMLPWVTSYPYLIRFIGISELLGGIGLILPSLLRIKPFLTPLAASCLAFVMVLASAFHIFRGEISSIGVNFIILAIAIFIAWGRTKKVIIESKL